MGRIYFANRGIPVDNEFLYTAQDPTLARAEEMSDYFIQRFLDGELDEVYVVYTEMVTSMLLEPRVRKMLPLDADSFVWAPRPGEEGLNQQKVTYVPSEGQVLSYLAQGYIKGAVLRHPGGVLLLRAERPHDGHGLLQQQRPGHAQGAVPAL